MLKTAKLQLNKPEGTDVVNIDDLNANMDILDNEVTRLASPKIDGRMSATDKAKLDGIQADAQKNTINSVNGKTGAITLTAADVGAASADELTSHKADYTKQLGTAELLTTDKTLKGSLNELFTNANNLKLDWVGVVGSPLLASDTSAQLKSKTQTLKNTMATNLTNKGQSASGNESLQSLVNKIVNINTGKKFATGTARSIVKEYDEVIRITGLAFAPSLIYVYSSPVFFAFASKYFDGTSNGIRYTNGPMYTEPTFTSSGCDVPVGRGGGGVDRTYQWVAVE